MFQVNTLGRLIIMCIASLLVVSGCSSSKHAAVMSGETLAEPTSSALEVSSTMAEKEGMPLSQGSMSQESLDGGARVVESSPGGEPAMASMQSESSFFPGLPTPPSFSGSLPGAGSGSTPSATSGGVLASDSSLAFFPGPQGGASTGDEGTDFARTLRPSDFVPEGPAHPTLGGEQVAMVDQSAPEGEAEEVVTLPHRNLGIEPLGEIPAGMTKSMGGGDSMVGLSHVFFDYDQYVIRDDAAEILVANATLLNSTYEDSNIIIQGYCDERGTTEYNLVLGERRAQSISSYLKDLGVAGGRIDVISYGEERPICHESNPACWQQNRRGQFVLQ